jgi:excisionase family DNA binding protein
MSDKSEWLTVPEATEALGISRQRVYQLINWGRLPGEKVGRTYRIPRAAVELRLAGEKQLNSNQCVSTKEVAEFFGVDVRTVRDWHVDGYLKARKIGNTLCFAPQDVITFVMPTIGGPGRHPAHTGTRTLRGRHYPAPAGQPETNQSNNPEREPK